jgi:CheY-like chemotaxis protein
MAPDNRARCAVPTILVVESDEKLRCPLSRDLRAVGCLVLDARDMAEALVIARTHSRPIHVLIMGAIFDNASVVVLQQYKPGMSALLLASDASHPNPTAALSDVVVEVQRLLASKSATARFD